MNNKQSCVGKPRWRQIHLRLMAGVALAALTFAAAPIVDGSQAPAVAQARVSVAAEFRVALAPHGRFVNHARWGEVWVPGQVVRGWRPYTVGRWAYTNDYGYYWVSDDQEAEWGWIVHHYGRWVFDEDLGWCWVAGDRWAPAWVQWRSSRDVRGDVIVGWAPLPPDEIVVEVVDRPAYWAFVPVRRFFEPRIWVSILEPRPIYFQRTVIVNRTVIVRDDRYRIAVNPGLAPGFVAARLGRPVRAYDVRPRVLAGLTQLPNAEVVRPGERVRERVRLRETNVTVRPEGQAIPQPLQPGSEGRLGPRPPRAAQGDLRTPGDRPGTTGQGQQQLVPDTRPDAGRSDGRSKGQQRPEAKGQRPESKQRQDGRPKFERGTEGRGAPDRPRAVEPKQRPDARPKFERGNEGRRGTEGRGAPDRPRAVAPKQRPEARPNIDRGTEGRGSRGGPDRPQVDRGPQQRPAVPPGLQRGPGAQRAPGATEGRGTDRRGPPRQAPAFERGAERGPQQRPMPPGIERRPVEPRAQIPGGTVGRGPDSRPQPGFDRGPAPRPPVMQGRPGGPQPGPQAAPQPRPQPGPGPQRGGPRDGR